MAVARTRAIAVAAAIAVGAIVVPATARAWARVPAPENSPLGLAGNSDAIRVRAALPQRPEMPRESAAWGYDLASDGAYATRGAAAGGARGTTGFVADAEVVSLGKVIGRGTVDVRGTVEGIQSGRLTPRDVFQNREGLLPRQASPGYYQEYVHPTPGVSGAGPQRIVGGRGGELYYTPDHYKTFIPLN